MENLTGTWSWKSFRRSVKNKSELPAREQIIPDQSTLRYVINFQRYINCKSLRLTKFFHSATIISKRFDSYRSVLLTLRMQSIIWVISCLDRFPSVIGWETYAMRTSPHYTALLFTCAKVLLSYCQFLSKEVTSYAKYRLSHSVLSLVQVILFFDIFLP